MFTSMVMLIITVRQVFDLFIIIVELIEGEIWMFKHEVWRKQKNVENEKFGNRI